MDSARLISEAFGDRSKLPVAASAVLETIEKLDRGELRVVEKTADGYVTHAWIKEAILLYFALRETEPSDAGPLHFNDKIPLKSALDGVRVVPPGAVRYGAHLERSVIVMPGYVNIGAYVGAGTMVDTWATVGSCAQIGRDCHLSGGVGIGGVLEPPQAQPVIIEDGCFIGSRAIVVEGVLIEKEAVIGAGVVLTASTAIIDVRGREPITTKGRIPPRAVVIPGTRPRSFPAGEFGVPCALIVGERTASTDRKVTLNAALRDFGVQA